MKNFKSGQHQQSKEAIARKKIGFDLATDSRGSTTKHYKTIIFNITKLTLNPLLKVIYKHLAVTLYVEAKYGIYFHFEPCGCFAWPEN